MAQAGQEIEGFGGFRLRFEQTAAETGGELLEMQARYPGDSPLPPEHLHPSQSERFEVLEGSVRALIGGVEGRYAAGDVFEVPAGTPHQMAAEEPTVMRWQVRPALRTAEFFEGLYGGAAAADFAAFLEEFRNEIRFTG